MTATWIILAASSALVLGAAVFLTVIVIGIRKGDRGDLYSPPENSVDALTRRVLGVGSRSNGEGDR